MIRRSTTREPLRVAVLVSGTGTNLQALLDRFGAAGSVVRIVAVGASNASAGGLRRARAAAVPTAVFGSGEGRDASLGAWLRRLEVELTVLAGYMAILGPEALAAAPAINVHPSLLPAFPGADAVAQALRHGVRVTGVTVHLVDAGVDTGPILVQESVNVGYDESMAELASRLRAIEHELLPGTVQLLAEDRYSTQGRHARVERDSNTR